MEFSALSKSRRDAAEDAVDRTPHQLLLKNRPTKMRGAVLRLGGPPNRVGLQDCPRSPSQLPLSPNSCWPSPSPGPLTEQGSGEVRAELSRPTSERFPRGAREVVSGPLTQQWLGTPPGVRIWDVGPASGGRTQSRWLLGVRSPHTCSPTAACQ